MIKRSVLVGMAAALLGLTLVTVSPAMADQSHINACQKVIATKTAKFLKGVGDIYSKCMTNWQKCRLTGTVATCQTSLVTPLGAACNIDKLRFDSATPGKVTKKLQGYQSDLDKKCDPTTVGAAKLSNAELLTIVAGLPYECVGTKTTGTAINGQGQEITTTTTTTTGITGLPDCSVPVTDYASFQKCMTQQQCEELVDGLFQSEPYNGVVAALTEAGVLPSLTPCLKTIGLANSDSFACGPDIVTSTNNAVGVHNAVADIKARLNTAVFPADITGIVGNFEMNVGSVDPNGVATIDVPSKSASFTPVAVVAFGLMVCTRQPTDGDGRLCCATGGCGGLGPKDYQAL